MRGAFGGGVRRGRVLSRVSSTVAIRRTEVVQRLHRGCTQ